MKPTLTAACLGLLLLITSAATAAQAPTKAAYTKIKLGMTEAQVEKLLGPATEIRDADDWTFLTWGELFKSITVQLADGKVISKSHFGLAEEADARKITRASYDRIETGMSRARVEAILGPGDEASVSQDMIILQWHVGLGSPESRWITIGILDGKVGNKSQKGLE